MAPQAQAFLLVCHFCSELHQGDIPVPDAISIFTDLFTGQSSLWLLVMTSVTA